MSTESPAVPTRRGRPRSESARKAILEAAADLLLARGLGAVSMDAVAERAGVSKATIYRWWPSKETLALDALYHEFAVVHPTVPCNGPLGADLLSDISPWIRLLVSRACGGVLAALIAAAQTDPGFAQEYRARFVEPRRERTRAIFRRSIERGELAPDTNIEVAMDLLYGPLYHRLLQGHAPIDERFLQDVVSAVLGGLVSTRRRRSAPAGEGLRPLAVDDVLALQRRGAQILDTRDVVEFERAHLAGAVNVGLLGDPAQPRGRGTYADWCETVLDRRRAVVIVADPGREQKAAARLRRIGFDLVEGYVEGGLQTRDLPPDRLAWVERVTATRLAEQLESAEPPLVVDVRTEREWHERRIAASLNMPLARITQRLDELPGDRALVVHCQTGYRSAIAASLLLRAQFGAVADLAGGIAAWQASDLETVGSA
jgi:rhodanese-related sulfurtransferase/DNA-binding transcriptional regulator YbjK